MGVINRTTDEINTLLDKVANLPEEGTSGKDGKTPVLETGTTTTLEAGSQATSEVVRNGEDASGNPKYKINFGIPKGRDGASSGGGGVADSVEWSKVLNKPKWIDSETKPTYNASEVGAIATGGLKTINGQNIEGEGDIEIPGTGSGIPDAPANGQTYGRNNNKWVVITQGGSDSAVDITEYFTKLLSLGEGETLPLEDYNVLKGYADNNTPVKIASEPYLFKTISVALMSIGDTLFLNGIIIQQGKLYGGYIFEIKNDGTITREIGGLPNIITFVDYQKAEKYTPITKGDTIQSAIQKLEAGIGQGGSGGGASSSVDITELFNRVNGVETGGTIQQEDYNTLLGYATNRTNVIVNNMEKGDLESSVRIFTVGDAIYIHFLYYAYGYANPSINIIAISSSLKIQKIAYGFQDAILLGEYEKASQYKPIERGDSISQAIGKLEAGIASSGGGSDVYILPQELYTLTNESTSEQISTAIGGDEGFNNIVAGIKAHKRFYFETEISEVSNAFCEVAMSYMSQDANNEFIIMRLSSLGSFGTFSMLTAATFNKVSNEYSLSVSEIQM